MSDVVEHTEVLVPGPAQGLAGLLGVPLPRLDDGEALPLAWHWLYLLDRPSQADLGDDGHPVRGAVSSPAQAGQRRMWAGGQVRTVSPLLCGLEATRRSRLASVEVKQGRSGLLTLATLEHQVSQDGRLVVEERQDIVYLPPQTPVQPQQLEHEVTEVDVTADEWAIEVSPALLFGYSALTFNRHRIHYDRDYAREVEGYPGLLVHGPLQAVAMAEAARARRHDRGFVPETFDYRLVAPLFDHQGMVVRATDDGARASTSVRDRAGRQTARGTLSGKIES